MHSFLDTSGRPWVVEINMGSIKRVNALVGVHLARLLEGEPPLLSRLDTDIELLCNVIFALVKPKADELQVTDEQFGAALGGEAIEQARTAFWGALADFFQSLHRLDVVKAIETQNRIVEAGVRAATAKMDTIDLAALVTQKIEALDLAAALKSTSGDSATNSPASSASTRTPEP